jgi:hypothetical protein
VGEREGYRQSEGAVGGYEPGLGFILAMVSLVYGGRQAGDWPFWRCEGVWCRGLSLAEAKRASLASWDG